MSEQTDRAELPPDRITTLWRRLKDHRIAQWTVGYVAVAYGIQHAITLTSEAYEWPNVVVRLSMTLLVLGLPVAMTLAWYHGDRVTRRVSGGEAAIVSLLLVLISLVFYVFVRPMEQTRPIAAAQQASVTAARTAAASPKGAVSVAVLPFLNLSSDKEQEFFSDGMTEEITAALAKVPDLRVVARTSAFEFKGKNVDIRTMGEQLGATHLIEGSVRKAGNRLRITAQLIKADDGTHIWAEDYDRDLTDVFAIQEDIARAITTSLHMTLGLKPGENLVNNRAIDPEFYDQFLRAEGLISARAGTAVNPGALAEMEQAASLLEGVVAKYPGYAPAWESLSMAYFQLGARHVQDEPIEKARAVTSELRQKGENAARKAIQLDPNLADGYAYLGAFAWTRGKLLDADAMLKKAMLLNFQTSTAGTYALTLEIAGHISEASALGEKVYGEDPLTPIVISSIAESRWLRGEDDAAIALAKTARPVTRAPVLSMIYASQGRFREAADALTEVAGNPVSAAAQAARLLRIAPTTIPREKLPRLPGGFQFIYLYVGAPERAIDNYERQVDAGYLGFAPNIRVWHPSYASARKTERFKTLMRKAGLVDYWRAKGWPPQCHPTTGDDFECS